MQQFLHKNTTSQLTVIRPPHFGPSNGATGDGRAAHHRRRHRGGGLHRGMRRADGDGPAASLAGTSEAMPLRSWDICSGGPMVLSLMIDIILFSY